MGFDPARIVQVWAPRPVGGGTSGSGYRISADLVLTAAHVVAGLPIESVDSAAAESAHRAQVAPLGTGTWTAAAVAFRDPNRDVAVLRCASTLPVLPPGSPEPRWGRIDGAKPVGCTAVGFPWAAVRPDRTRDTEHLFGFLPPLSGSVEGVQAVTVLTAAPLERSDDGSPWAGMSGAALFAGRFLVGVIVVDPTRFGPDRLHAAPLAPLLENSELARLLGLVVVQPVRLPDRLAITPNLTIALRPPYQPLPTDVDPARAPAQLLLPQRGIVPFTGRRSHLHELRRWACHGGRLALRVVTGAGGAGKTRLAAEVCTSLAGDGFDVGFADPGQPGGEVTLDYDRRTLLVVDDADLQVPLLTPLLTRLEERPADAPPVRLLLLARHMISWWDNLNKWTNELADQYADRPVELTSGQLNLDDRQVQYQWAAAAFGQLRRSPLDGQIRPLEHAGTQHSVPDLTDAAFANPLLVHMTALLAVFPNGTGPTLPTPNAPQTMREKVLRGVLRREQAHWADTDGYPGDIVAAAAVTLATLLTPPSRPAALDTLTGIPDLADSAAARGRTADWLHRLYPDSAGWLAPLRPDLVAEQLLATVPDLPDLVLAAYPHAATMRQTAQLLSELTRAATRPTVRPALDRLLATHLPDLLADAVTDSVGPLPTALDLALDLAPQPTIAAQLVGRLPERSVNLATFATTLTGQAVDYYRALSATPGSDDISLCMWLVNLAVRLDAVGRYDDAVTATTESLAVAEDVSRVPRLLLADILAVHSTALFKADHPVAAVDAGRRAVELFRELAENGSQPERAAEALNTLALASGRLGRLTEAVEYHTAALHAEEQLPDGPSLPFLAVMLSNLSATYYQLERDTEALDAAERSTKILRELVAQDRAAYLQNLAMSLNNLSCAYGRVADGAKDKAAVAAAKEAVAYFAELADHQPDRYLPDLAMALATYAGGLASVDRLQEAVIAARDAVEIRAQSSTSTHARSLLAQLLFRLGRAEEAVETARAAAQSLRQQPPSSSPSAAKDYRALAGLLSEHGHLAEALDLAVEAAAMFHEAADADSSFLLPWVGEVTDVEKLLGLVQGEVDGTADPSRVRYARVMARALRCIVQSPLTHWRAGQLDEVIPLYERTVVSCERVLGGDDPDTLGSRCYLAEAYQSAGQLDKTTRLYEQILADQERLFGPDHPAVAAALYRLASVQLSLGDPSTAAHCLRRAVGIDETAYGGDHPEVATDLEALAIAQEMADEKPAAVASLCRALEIRRQTGGPEAPGLTELEERISGLRSE